MTPLEAKQYLDSFVNYELKPSIPYASSLKLERVTHLLNLIGNPHKKIKTIHVAGTKGKGSTCMFTASILERAGYRVGLYTSPHLNNHTERIRILDSSGYTFKNDVFRGKIKEEEFCRILEEIKPVIEAVKKERSFKGLSYFEIYTAVALFYFCERKVDFTVIETGLGGRLDATNVVDSLVCAITPLSIEHVKQLGATLKGIAKEKAAIIKDKNQIAIIAPQEKEALKVVRERCRQFGVRAFFVGQDIFVQTVQKGFKEQIFDVQGIKGSYQNLKTGLLGQHQTINACVAVGIVESLSELGFPVDSQAIHKGIENALWPGRLEIVKENPTVILDGAHNPGSCKVVASAIRDIFPQKKVTLILGISNDKDTRGICSELNKIADDVILTKARHPRALDFTHMELNGLFENKNVTLSRDIDEAVKIAFDKKDSGNVILITGSLFIVGEARELCINRN